MDVIILIIGRFMVFCINIYNFELTRESCISLVKLIGHQKLLYTPAIITTICIPPFFFSLPAFNFNVRPPVGDRCVHFWSERQ